MMEPRRQWKEAEAGLERKILAAGRPWTVGDTVMVGDGQWGVGARPERWLEQETVVEHRSAEGRRVELTVEELARAVGTRIEDAHHDED